MKRVPGRHLLFAVMSSCLLAGCGAPDLESMKPSVDKSSAVVVLVDQPQGWNANAAGALAAQKHVTAKVVSCRSGELAQVLNKSLAQYSVGMYLVVSPGSPQPEALNVARQHLGQRFEWVSSAPIQSDAVNVGQVVPDTKATSYALGWLAATLAAEKNAVPRVGWLSGPAADSGTVRSALTGMYAANAAVTLVSVSPPGNTPANAPSVTVLPPVVVTAHALSGPESTWLRSSGVTVISLLPQPDQQVAAEPGFPGPAAAAGDLQRFAERKWQSGVRTVLPDPLVDFRDPLIAKHHQTSMQALAMSFASHSVDVQRAWQQIPASLRDNWVGITGALR